MRKLIKTDFDKTNDDPPSEGEEVNAFDFYWNQKKSEWEDDAENKEHDPDRDYDLHRPSTG